MIPVNPWEHQNTYKTLYSKCVGDICDRHKITRMELDILLFLANNPCFDTATDMVEVRHLSKSQVSSSIKQLEAGGYLRKEYAEGNRKTAHLRILEAAADIIADGRRAQEKFMNIMLRGFTPEEVGQMRNYSERIRENMNLYLRQSE